MDTKSRSAHSKYKTPPTRPNWPILFLYCFKLQVPEALLCYLFLFNFSARFSTFRCDKNNVIQWRNGRTRVLVWSLFKSIERAERETHDPWDGQVPRNCQNNMGSGSKQAVVGSGEKYVVVIRHHHLLIPIDAKPFAHIRG